MKLTNQSARVYYVDGKQIMPGATAEVADSWKENKTVQASIAKGELRIEAESETQKNKVK